MTKLSILFCFLLVLSPVCFAEEIRPTDDIDIWAISPERERVHDEIWGDFEFQNNGFRFYQETFGYDFQRVIDETLPGVGYMVWRNGKRKLYIGVWTVGDLLEKIYPKEIREKMPLLNPKLALLNGLFPS